MHTIESITAFVRWLCGKLTRDELTTAAGIIDAVLKDEREDIRPRNDFQEKHPNYRKFNVDPNPPLTEALPLHGPEPTLDYRELIAEHSTLSRRALSKKLCEAWGWVQPNGALRDMVCRSLMLELHRAGQIELPPVRFRPQNPMIRRRRPEAVELDSTTIQCRLGDLEALEVRQVRRTEDEALVGSLIEQHHYLGYTQPVGEHLKYLVVSGSRPVACFVFSSAPRHLGPRDRYIGWDAGARRRNIGLVAYNSRFLLLPKIAA